jgi:hypothetical protein
MTNLPLPLNLKAVNVSGLLAGSPAIIPTSAPWPQTSAPAQATANLGQLLDNAKNYLKPVKKLYLGSIN